MGHDCLFGVRTRKSFFLQCSCYLRDLPSFPTRRSSDLAVERGEVVSDHTLIAFGGAAPLHAARVRSEEHTSELQSRLHLVCRLLLEKKNNYTITWIYSEYDSLAWFFMVAVIYTTYWRTG